MPCKEPANPRESLTELEALLQGAQVGMLQARIDLHQQYTHFFVDGIWRHLKRTHPLRRLYDPDEIVQDVGKALLCHEVPPGIFQSQTVFFAYLKKMVRNRLSNLIRKHLRTQKTDLKREVPLRSVLNDIDLVCRRPTPEKVCEARDEWEKLTRYLPAEQTYMLFLLDRAFTHEEVARNMDISERTVDRWVAKIKATARR